MCGAGLNSHLHLGHLYIGLVTPLYSSTSAKGIYCKMLCSASQRGHFIFVPSIMFLDIDISI